MKNILIIIFAFLLINLKLYSKVDKISYRGWSNCFKIYNDSIEVIINPKCGARVMKFALHGLNMIYEDSSQNRKNYTNFLSERFDPDGGRFDYGPEDITRNLHDLTWMGEWKGEVTSNFSIVLTSQIDQKLGVQTVREFTLDSINACLSIKQTMRNTSDSTTKWFFWGRTLVPAGGKMIVPINPESKYPKGWGKYNWGSHNMPFLTSNVSDPSVSTGRNILLFTPSASTMGKYGTDSHDGWIAYGYKDVLFVKRFKFFPDKNYTEKFGLTIVFYTNGKEFSEMEPVSPQAILAPGETYSFTESWYLFPYQTLNISIKTLNKISKLVHAKTRITNY